MLTLLEASKNYKNPVESAIVEMFAMYSSVLSVLPFDDIVGNALQYNREEALAGVAFRGLNEAYAESTGILNPQVERLVIGGGDLDVDTFITATMGPGQRAVHESMKVKALALNWMLKFFKGDADANPREFDGLQRRLTGNQIIEAGSTDGGDALSLEKLDELRDQVDQPTHYMLNRTMIRRLSTASRSTTIGGFITTEKDDWGRPLAMYGGLPLLPVDEDNEGNQILPFTEVGSGGSTATATSIYCMSTEPEHTRGIQNKEMEVRDLGELQAKPAERSRVEWFTGIALKHGKAAARLRGVKNAAVTA